MAPEGGESVADVASRFSAVLLSAETQFHGSAILIVSHGDPLQIFQAVLSGAKENMSFLDDLTNLKVKDTDDLTNLEVKDTMVASILSQHRKFALITGELRRVV
ncbi:Phosphoglycerate mutase family protein [Zea mays]|nr:Phosphoglycerate mutase family protein [Zea mays]